MKPIEQFVSELSELGIKLSINDDRLRCEAPKGVLTKALRTQLVERKAEIISFLRQEQQPLSEPTRTRTLHSIQPAPRDGQIPLSFAQEQLWLTEQLEGANAINRARRAVRLIGELNIGALEQSLNEMVCRHESLRTTFAFDGTQPIQLIQDPFKVNLPAVDLEPLSSSEQEATIRRLAFELAKGVFDLEKGPLLRTTLFSLGNKEHVLLFVIHHIITDGWSTALFMKELLILYEIHSQQKPNPLPELKIQYADYAYWQRQLLQGKELKQQLAYWKQHLGGELPILKLPRDYPASARQAFTGGTLVRTLSSDLSSKITLLSKQKGVTLFMTLLATFNTLLYRYTQQEDIIIGMPITGRHRTELEGLIGIFVNALVLRCDLSGNPTFTQLLHQVRQVTLDAYTNQDIPFSKLVQELQPERNLSRNPLFQVWFNMLQLERLPYRQAGLTIETLPLFERTAMFDLNLYISNSRTKEIQLKWVYKVDQFSETPIKQMASHFESLLENIVADPTQRISSLSFLTDAERHQLLIEWGRTPTILPEHLCIHQLFEDQVRRTPDAIAVTCKGGALTYQELNTSSNQLAHYLQRRGVGPEVLVGICMTRSLDMVVGILGILKAGGAYVPLDPMYPKERIAFILQDTQINILLTQTSLQSRFTSLQTEILCMDTEWAAITLLPSTNPINNAQAENLAYVIYTSGSTGKPKGVMITHKSLCFFVKTVELTLGISASDVYLQTGSITYALSVRQLMIALCHGATLVVATELEVRDPLSLFTLIKEQGVTRMDFVPSHWRACNQALATLDPTLRAELLDNDLRHIVSIGEPLLSDIPSQWRFDFNHPAQLVNIFGQTETSGVVMAYPIPAKHEDRVKVVPIGRPAANTQIYILDSNLQPVPAGVAGILHISSPSLARGYLDRPELTAKKFISNPFSNDPKARLYNTGDLARYSLTRDGNVEFLGRKDYQVKLRGMRIELGEIEGILLQHPAVQKAVVIAREETPDNKRLVAYLVTSQPTPQGEELRDFIKKKVSNYMVPSAFVFLSAMPLTPNGKVDRRRLPDPSDLEDQSTDAPQSQKEIAESFYVPSWKRSSRLLPPTNLQRRLSEGTWLLFVDQCGLGTQIARRLRKLGASSVITVSIGQQFNRLGEEEIQINPTRPDDYHLLLKELNILGQSPLNIFHLWSVTPDQPPLPTIFDDDVMGEGENGENSSNSSPSPELGEGPGVSAKSFYSLLYLAQALAPLTMPIQIALVSNQMQEVTGEEELCPEKATLLGSCKVIPLEYPNITCRSIDIILPSLIDQGELQKLVEPLITELTSGLPEKIVAYRGRYRWVQYLEHVRLDSPLKQTIRLREKGVYLITGGLGGIGLELATYLAQTVRAKLVLVSRSAPHDQEAHKIEKVRQLRQMGAELLLLRADVSNRAQMQALIAETLEHFGALHGVIHAAGVRGVFETIEQKTAQRAATVLAAKVNGTLVLEDVLKGIKLDFVLLCSSLASIVGRFGQVDYCAANAFLDAFAADHTRRGTFTVSVNWDIWQELKLPVKSNESFAIRQLLEVDMQKGLLSQEAVEAFSRILASNLHQVIVSKRDILGQATLINQKGQSQVQLTSLHEKPRTAIEELLATIWGQFLKRAQVGIHDNFFELGGHSLLAVQVISRMRADFSLNFSLRHLFEFPTIAELSEIVQTLSQSKSDPIVPAPRDNVLPLSFGQRRLWDWQHLAGESATYKVSYFRILKGRLNLVALEQSFSELVSRHEGLRTTFPVIEGHAGQPIQLIHSAENVSLPLIDLQGLSEEGQECEMRRLAAENAFKPFDLAKGPLFRIAILRLATEEHVLLLTFHHIIIDGWSRRRLLREWSTLYEAFLQAKPFPLPDMSLQYADFAHWQRHTQKEVEAKQLAYWKEQLGGQLPVLAFPQDYPRPAQPTFKGESQAIYLCKSFSDALKRLSQQESCTLFMTMLAAFKALLYHKTGQEDLIIGSPNANRTHPEIQDIVGYFVNPLALRTNLQGNPTFRELLYRVRQVVLGAYTHQEVPFEKIVAELHPKRDLNRDPIFAVWFNMLNLEKQVLELKGVTVQWIKLTNKPTAMFDLTLSIREVDETESLVNEASDGGLRLNLTYKADLFGSERMAHLLTQYQKLLARAAEQPETRLFDLLPKKG